MKTGTQSPVYRVAVFKVDKKICVLYEGSTEPTEAEILEALQGLDKRTRKEFDVA